MHDINCRIFNIYSSWEGEGGVGGLQGKERRTIQSARAPRSENTARVSQLLEQIRYDEKRASKVQVIFSHACLFVCVCVCVFVRSFSLTLSVALSLSLSTTDGVHHRRERTGDDAHKEEREGEAHRRGIAQRAQPPCQAERERAQQQQHPLPPRTLWLTTATIISRDEGTGGTGARGDRLACARKLHR